MAGKEVNDILNEGIYGKKELRPDEKRQYLGVYRERILLVLTKKQVMEKGTRPEVEAEMKKHKDAALVLNGKMSYQALKGYQQTARKYGIEYTNVSSLEHVTEVGLVLAKPYAVHKEEIEVEDRQIEAPSAEKKPWWKRIFA
ncbi:YueI family protein [Sinobaca sp. H24]|uniref:YueI family protein n=1 Tax=Sinobaca sp. H24 TaxID=2923376 RepID=UPI0020798A8A|nr:YueI family protein [Sinobaca sp. H24]